MTLKLKGDLDVLQLYPHTEKSYQNISRSKLKINMPEAPNYFEPYRNRYFDQALSIYDR